MALTTFTGLVYSKKCLTPDQLAFTPVERALSQILAFEAGIHKVLY